MSVKLLAITLIIGVGLIVVVAPRIMHGSNGDPGLGNCYADSGATATPTICQSAWYTRKRRRLSRRSLLALLQLITAVDVDVADEAAVIDVTAE